MSIEWTQHTLNPFIGCTKHSMGCANCYAEREAKRLAGNHKLSRDVRKAYHNWGGDPRFFPERLEPLKKWTVPRMVFLGSMTDIFHEMNTTENILTVFNAVMGCIKKSGSIFQILTKRTERMAHFTENYFTGNEFHPQLWLGASIERDSYRKRLDDLTGHLPGAGIRFISYEPALGALDCLPEYIERLDWVIAGGESGKEARATHPNWIRRVRNITLGAGKKFFFKSWGEHIPFSQLLIRQRCVSDPFNKYPSVRVEDTVDGCTSVASCHRVGRRNSGRNLDHETYDQIPRVIRPADSTDGIAIR